MKLVIIAFAFVSASIHASEVGRYQLVTHPVSPNRTLLIDTSTGRLWEKTCYKQKEGEGASCDVAAWAPYEIIGINSDLKKISKLVNSLDGGNGYGKDAPPPR